jgi:hypothetical protein
MQSFEEAERARDTDALIAHFAAIPEFHIYSDGNRLSYDEMTSDIRKTFPTLRSIEGGFVDLNVIVLAADAALVAGTFREGQRTHPAIPHAFVEWRHGYGARSMGDG